MTAARHSTAGHATSPAGIGARTAPTALSAVRGFRAEIDSVTRAEWDAVVAGFDDAILHQGHAYGTAVHGAARLSHLLLRDGSRVVAAAQVALRGLPRVGLGVAHVKFGPLWRRRDEMPDPAVQLAALEALRREYAERRGLLLRVKPWTASAATGLDDRMQAAGFRRRDDLPCYDTLLLDLRMDLLELRRSLKPKWRYNLRHAERQPCTVEAMPAGAGLADFLRLYRRMSHRKGFYDSSEIDRFATYCRQLPTDRQPLLLFCRYRGERVAGLVLSAQGSIGYYWFGATAGAALERRVSYVLHWEAVSRLKAMGCCWYDLAGVSQPGVYRFKSGLAGREGRRVHMVDYDACSNPFSRYLADAATLLRNVWRRAGIITSRHVHAHVLGRRNQGRS